MSKDASKYDKLFDDDEQNSEEEIDNDSVCEEKKPDETNLTPAEIEQKASLKAYMLEMPKQQYQAAAYLYNDKYRDKFIAENPQFTKETKFQTIKNIEAHKKFTDDIIKEWNALHAIYREKYEAWKSKNPEAVAAHEASKKINQQSRRERKRSRPKKINGVEPNPDDSPNMLELKQAVRLHIAKLNEYAATIDNVYSQLEKVFDGNERRKRAKSTTEA